MKSLMRAEKKVLAGFLALALGGCALQADLVDIQDSLEDLMAKQHGMEGNIEVPDQTATTTPTTEESMSGLFARMDQFSSELQTVQGKLEQEHHTLGRLVQRMDTLAYRIEQLDRQTGGRTGPGSRSPAPGAPEETKQAGVSGDRLKLPGQAPSGSLTPTEVYNLAYNDYLKGNYELAVASFEVFLKQFPDSTLAPRAAYWLGESYFSHRKFFKAIGAFDHVVERFPESEKVPAAMLKKGFTYLEVRDKVNARLAFKKVIEEYPFSSESDLAKNQLTEIH